MTTWTRRLVLGSVLVASLLAIGWVAAQQWLGSDDFRRRVEVAATDAAGVPVAMGRISLVLWPVPAMALDAVRVETVPAWTVDRIEARAVLSAALRGRVELATLLVRRADLSQAGWDHLQMLRKKKQPAADSGEPVPLPRRLVLDTVTWRPTGGDAISIDADTRLAVDGLPDTLSVKVLAGQFQGARLKLERKLLVWAVQLDLARGTIKGDITLDKLPAAGVDVAATGRLTTEGVELGALSRQRLTGQLNADTTLSLRTGRAGALVDALQTQSRFTVRNAVVHGVDLARAVKTVGLSRGGETRLDALAGQVVTRGRAVALTHLVASSGLLSAGGQVTLSPNRALSGRVQVNLGAAAIGEAVGVPLVVGGTLDAPELTLTRSAMVGAAIGTMVMPGVGTGAGASLGDKIGGKLQGLFGK